MSKLDELKEEATALGITYSPNIGEAKLQAKIDAKKEVLEPAEPVEDDVNDEPVVDDWIAKAAAKADAEEAKEADSGGWGPMQRRKLAAEREANARKTKVITIIDNDQRENNQTTTCTVTCNNEMFSLGTVILPLNMDVEVMQGHINQLRDVKIPQHVKGSDGLNTTVLRPRYTISYSDVKPD